MAELFGRVDGVLQGPRRLDAHVRPRAALHGRLRDRRRQPADRRRLRPGLRLPGHRGRDAVHLRRRRLQPGHLRRDDEPRRAVEAAGRLHGHQQPVRHGHRARAPLGRHRPAGQGRGLRRARAWSATAWTCSTPTTSRRRRCASRARSAGRCSSRPSPTASAATRWPTPRSTAPRSRSRSGASATRSCSAATASRPRGSSAPTSASSSTQDAVAQRRRRPWPSPTSRRCRAPESLYDDVYVLGGQVRGWYSVDERSAGVHKGEDERELAEQHGELQLGRQRRARRATSRSR